MRKLLLAVLLLALAGAALPALAQADATPEPDTAPADTAAHPASGMAVGLRHLHAWTRWLVVVVAVAALARMAAGYFQDSVYDGWARRLMLTFSVAMTLQWLIGVVFFLVIDGLNVRYRWEHAAIMTVAVGLSHMHNRWKNADARTRHRNSLLIVLAVLVLVYVGVALLPQGWRVMPAG